MKKFNLIFFGIIILFILSCKEKDIQYTYYPDGTLKQVAEVKNGRRNGVTKNYDEHGRLVSTAELKNDVHYGLMVNYNPNNHKVIARAMFKNDKQNGPLTLYYTDGQLYRESWYKNGLVDSIVKTYWPGGKLQAENYFKLGNASIDLKEYDKQGNLIKQPSIVIEETDQIARFNRLLLKIYLSDGAKNVEFYEGDLLEGKFFNPDLSQMTSTDGVVTRMFVVPRRSVLMKKISVIAKCRTENGNTLILHKDYKITSSN